MKVSDHKLRCANGRLRRARRGLAPLELAMWIPALLFVAVLMLNFGTVVVWRARGEIASRDGAWRARPTREPGLEAPLRPIWPADAQLQVVPDIPIVQLDNPAINQPVVRGPLPNGFIVRDTLNPLKGAYHGSGAVTRNYPLLPKSGPYKTGEIRDPMFDLIWTCRETGTWVNIARRTQAIYQLPTTDPSLPQAFTNAYTSIISIPHFAALDVLDHDEEVRKYKGYYADFHPRINRGCQLDPKVIQQTEVNRLVISTTPAGKKKLGQILKLPASMTGYYLAMYKAEIARLQAIIDDPLSSPAQKAAAQAALPPLETKASQLEQFQDRISDWEQEVLTR